MKKILDLILSRILIFLLGIMLLSVLWQVFSRYFLGAPSSFTEELARFLLIWIGILGGAYASGRQLHLSINLIPERLPDYQQIRLQILCQALVATFAIMVLCIGGSRLVYITQHLGQYSPAMGVPMSVVYCILPLSGMVILLYSGIELKSIFNRNGS